VSISLVIPIYNEQACIVKNLTEILKTIDQYNIDINQVIIINDGSVDESVQSLSVLLPLDPRLELISFTRNFGKEAAIYAGLLHCRGDAAIVMDSDLQHPPNLISRMVEGWQQGFDVVEACKSRDRHSSLLRRWITNIFYSFFAFVSKMDLHGQTDYKLLDRQVIETYCKLPERKRFFRGLIPWLGFSTKQIWFEVPIRQGDVSKWSLPKLTQLGLTAITSFSSSMLHFVSISAATCFIISIVFASISLIQKMSGVAVSGFTTINILVLFIGSIIMFSLGQIGIYIEHLFDESKNRPIYIIDKKKSFNNEEINHD
jgi:glycosyltransferase involved in cell wall biosynthesis